MVDHVLGRQLDLLALRSMPALRTELYDGWLLRFTQGFTGRANSVTAMDAGVLALDEKIAYCEARYIEHELPIMFRLTDMSQPAELEAVLIKRGYELRNGDGSLTQVQTAAIAAQDIDTGTLAVRQYSQANAEWVEAIATLAGKSVTAYATLQSMLVLVEQPVCCALLLDGDEPIAVGIGVVEGDWLGVFSVMVAESRRRQGLGTLVMQVLFNWAVEAGASRSYLQVEAQNSAALRLYAKLGYQPVYRYWYRVKA